MNETFGHVPLTDLQASQAMLNRNRQLVRQRYKDNKIALINDLSNYLLYDRMGRKKLVPTLVEWGTFYKKDLFELCHHHRLLPLCATFSLLSMEYSDFLSGFLGMDLVKYEDCDRFQTIQMDDWFEQAVEAKYLSLDLTDFKNITFLDRQEIAYDTTTNPERSKRYAEECPVCKIILERGSIF